MSRPIMKPWQFTIRNLLLAIVLVAIACAALLNANAWWASGCQTAAVALLTCAILLAIHSDTQRRSYWLGFEIAGWIYLLLPTMSALGLSVELISEKALDAVYPLFPWQEPKTTPGTGILSLRFPGASSMTEAELNHWNSFHSVGHALFTVLAALMGGTLSRWLYDRRRLRSADEAQ